MGNLIMDQNKKIESITYNHLNLPMRIIFSKEGENTISYLYDALGRKKDKIVTTTEGEAFERIKTEYMGGFQYAEGELQFFPTAQGYVRVVDGNYFYIYNMTDHLGNIRLSYTQDKDGELQIIEESHYYPYGLKHQNYNVDKLDYVEGENGYVLASESALQYKYKFNGMELQEELGLNWYDMDFRDYDPAIGRWTGIDPITHHNMSPYIAFDGNLVYWADPSGADSYDDAMTAFNRSGSGMTTYTNDGMGYTQTSFIDNGFFEDENKGIGGWVRDNGSGLVGWFSGNNPKETAAKFWGLFSTQNTSLLGTEFFGSISGIFSDVPQILSAQKSYLGEAASKINRLAGVDLDKVGGNNIAFEYLMHKFFGTPFGKGKAPNYELAQVAWDYGGGIWAESKLPKSILIKSVSIAVDTYLSSQSMGLGSDRGAHLRADAAYHFNTITINFITNATLFLIRMHNF